VEGSAEAAPNPQQQQQQQQQFVLVAASAHMSPQLYQGSDGPAHHKSSSLTGSDLRALADLPESPLTLEMAQRSAASRSAGKRVAPRQSGAAAGDAATAATAGQFPVPNDSPASRNSRKSRSSQGGSVVQRADVQRTAEEERQRLAALVSAALRGFYWRGEE
jgi:hypothetical protein